MDQCVIFQHHAVIIVVHQTHDLAKCHNARAGKIQLGVLFARNAEGDHAESRRHGAQEAVAN